MQVDTPYTSNSRPRAKTSQLGSNSRSNYKNIRYIEKLVDYEYAFLYEATVSACINIVVNTVVSSLGTLQHVDPDIEAFLKYNVNYLDNKKEGTSLSNIIKLALKTAKWAGNSLGEKVYTLNKSGQEYVNALLLEDLVIYHPTTVIYRTNKQGRLTEGEDTNCIGLKSGIYQRDVSGLEVKLPKWKVVHLVNNFSFNSYYGRSDLDSVDQYIMLKEYLIDMRNNALKKFGDPVIAITIPVHNTTDTVVNPVDGSVKTLTTFDTAKQDLTENEDGNLLLLPYLDKDKKPEAKPLVTGINIGSSFEDAIKHCDKEISKGLGVPYIMISPDVGIRSGAERQIEIFNQVIEDVFTSLVCPLISQLFSDVIYENFKGRDTAIIPAKITFKSKIRAEDRVAIMQMITGLTSKGYFNPTAEDDWNMIRELVGVDARQMTEEDIDFIKDTLIKPLNRTNNSDEEPEDRSKEGNVKGKGNTGRPVGVSKPQQKAR